MKEKKQNKQKLFDNNLHVFSIVAIDWCRFSLAFGVVVISFDFVVEFAGFDANYTIDFGVVAVAEKMDDF